MTTKTTASIPSPVWREIAVADIATDGTNPRTLFDTNGDAGLTDLAASIKAHGLLQPIIVRVDADADVSQPPYLLVAGERRLRATRDLLHRPTIAAILRHDLTDDTALEATVLENLQRRDLHPLEEARGLAALRARPGYTPQQIAKKLGRGKEWIKDRLKLCDLPATTQDLYLRDTTGRLTLTKMLKLHEYTHGNKDNTGFPRLIEAMAEDIATGVNSDAHPATTARLHAGLVTRLTHWHTAQGGRYGDNYFDTYSVCRACPFAAYRSPYGDYEGFCLMPDHYAALQAKGKAAYEEAEAARQQDAPAALPGAAPIGSSGYTPVEKTAAQKGQETRKRRLAQKADYTPNLLAVRSVVDLIATVEAHDLATLAAYTLAHVSLHKEDWAEIARRHGVDAGALMRAGGSAHPRAEHITGLRTLDPRGLVKATVEALLTRQAQAARDYEPDNHYSTGPDPVFKLYTGDQTSAPPMPPAPYSPLPNGAGDTGQGDATDTVQTLAPAAA
jgi:ParB/RepB/Spo0J family partition protein